ncbi:MAG: hypothetical protein H6706_27855 [Myxococcales bacterium]|nr:hypothetical protein [Myxococcales bacterium]
MYRCALGLALTGCLDFGPRADAAVAAAGDAGAEDAAPADPADVGEAWPDAARPPALAALSDEFDAPGAAGAWQVLDPAGFLLVDHGRLHAGRLTLRAPLGGWHDARTAGLLFVEVEGDFGVDAAVVAGRIGAGEAPPEALFNVAGLLARDPTSPQEDWTFVGVGRLLGELGVEGKVTTAGVSAPVRRRVGQAAGWLRICRVGADVALLRRRDDDGGWLDAWEAPFVPRGWPARVQVGVFAHGWNSAEAEPATEGLPDLEATVDAVRFWRPASPADCLRPPVGP